MATRKSTPRSHHHSVYVIDRGACDMEVELGIALRERGFGVWQA